MAARLGRRRPGGGTGRRLQCRICFCFAACSVQEKHACAHASRKRHCLHQRVLCKQAGGQEGTNPALLRALQSLPATGQQSLAAAPLHSSAAHVPGTCSRVQVLVVGRWQAAHQQPGLFSRALCMTGRAAPKPGQEFGMQAHSASDRQARHDGGAEGQHWCATQVVTCPVHYHQQLDPRGQGA